MPVPQYNPTKVLIETVKEQGYDPGVTGWSIADSQYPMGFPPLGPFEQADEVDHPGMTEAQALTRRGAGDPGEPKYSPKNSNMGL